MLVRELFSGFNWVDLLAAILLIRAIYIGSNVGLSIEIFKFIGILSALIFSIHSSKSLASLATSYISMPPAAAEAVSFLVIVFAFVLGFKFIRTFFQVLVKFHFVEWLERYGGLSLGLARGVITTAIILIFLSMLPSDYLKASIDERSFSGRYFLKAGMGIYGLVCRGCPQLKQDIVK